MVQRRPRFVPRRRGLEPTGRRLEEPFAATTTSSNECEEYDAYLSPRSQGEESSVPQFYFDAEDNNDKSIASLSYMADPSTVDGNDEDSSLSNGSGSWQDDDSDDDEASDSDEEEEEFLIAQVPSCILNPDQRNRSGTTSSPPAPIWQDGEIVLDSDDQEDDYENVAFQHIPSMISVPNRDVEVWSVFSSARSVPKPDYSDASDAEQNQESADEQESQSHESLPFLEHQDPAASAVHSSPSQNSSSMPSLEHHDTADDIASVSSQSFRQASLLFSHASSEYSTSSRFEDATEHRIPETSDNSAQVSEEEESEDNSVPSVGVSTGSEASMETAVQFSPSSASSPIPPTTSSAAPWTMQFSTPRSSEPVRPDAHTSSRGPATTLRDLKRGDPVSIVGGVHAGKQGTFVKLTPARVCVEMSHVDTPRYLLPSNVRPLTSETAPLTTETAPRSSQRSPSSSHGHYGPGDLLDVVGGKYKGRQAVYLVDTPKRVRVLVEGMVSTTVLAPTSVAPGRRHRSEKSQRLQDLGRLLLEATA